jgi:general secretion pathway protein J
LKHFALANRNRDARAGFSLIEVLAALAIAGAVFAVIAEFAGRTLYNWKHGEATVAVMEMLTRGLGRLGTDLTEAVPMTPPGTDGSTVYFSGDATHMRFVAATGFGAGNRAFELLDISQTTENNDQLLVRKRATVSNPPAPLQDPVVLLRGRIQIRFSYRNNDGQTVPAWNNKAELPSAVLVEVLDSNGTAVFPAPFLLPVPVNYGVDCFDSADDNVEKPQRCVNAQNQQATPATDNNQQQQQGGATQGGSK